MTSLRFSTKAWEGNLVQRKDHHFPLAVTALGSPQMFSTEVRSLGVLWCSYFMTINDSCFSVLFSYPHCYSQITTVTVWILLFSHNIMTWKAAPWAYAGEPAGEPAVWLRVTTEEMDYTWLHMQAEPGMWFRWSMWFHLCSFLQDSWVSTRHQHHQCFLFKTCNSSLFCPDMSGHLLLAEIHHSQGAWHNALWKNRELRSNAKSRLKTNCFLFARWCTVLFFSSHSWMLASHLSRHLLKIFLDVETGSHGRLRLLQLQGSFELCQLLNISFTIHTTSRVPTFW